jgi:hypothetical protein
LKVKYVIPDLILQIGGRGLLSIAMSRWNFEDIIEEKGDRGGLEL